MNIERYGHLVIKLFTKCLLITILLFVTLVPKAQAQQSFSRFDKLSVGLNAGTTGLGIEFSTPICSWARVRAGASFMPSFTVPMTFGLASYVPGESAEAISSEKFDKVNAILQEFTGLTINQTVDMNAKASMPNASVIVDFFPLRNKHFYVSAGFYWGKGRIGHIENNLREMPTLMGILVYNSLYDYFMSERYLDEPLLNDIYLDPDVGDQLRDRFASMGIVGAHIGEFKSDGTPYMMKPDKDGVIEANMFVNNFKPYLGVGYDCNLSRDGQWRFGVNAGVWLWGGAPNIVTHEGVSLTKDLYDIRGKVGNYVDLVSKLKVFPAINVALRYNILF